MRRLPAGMGLTDRVSNTRLFFVLGTLACTPSSVPAKSHSAEEFSVPEPTQLQAVATAPGSELVRSEALGSITSADSIAEIAVIEVTAPNGDRVRGVRIDLEDSETSDQIYIPESLLSTFRDELQRLESMRQSIGECRARYRCIHGIARCRPSQTERQAYCPGRYSTSNSEEGLILATPRSSFSFPGVDVSELDDLIIKANRALR